MIKLIFHTLSIWIIILPSIAGFVNYKGLNKDSKWIFFLVLIAVPPQLLTFVVKQENVLLNISYNLYTPIEFIILYLLFKDKYSNNISKLVLTSTVIIYCLLSVYLLNAYGISNQFISSWVCVNNIIYIIWILFFLKEQYQIESFTIERGNPFSLYILALIFYAPLTLITFALYYYIRKDAVSVLQYLSLIQDICNIILYVFFSIGLFKSKA